MGEYVKERSASPRGDWFREARFGMFIHWGIYAIPAHGEWTLANDPWNTGEYEALAGVFNPTRYDPREWARLAKRAGMKYAVLTTRHHDGFCMFDSHFTDYKITKTPFGRDAVREFADAFRAEGLRVGFYHSLPDWTHPGYADPETPAAMQGRPTHEPRPEEHAAFRKLIANHVRQLLTEYGKIDLLFLDYTSKHKADTDYFDRERILEIAYECQPDILAAGLVGCVSRNGNLLLNVGPLADGSIPKAAVERLVAMGEWFAANGESIYGCGKSAFTPPFGCAYTQRGNALYCHFLQPPIGDVILPGLKGKVAKITLLRTGEEIPCIDHWGFELLGPGDQRIRPKNVLAGDVAKIELTES